ncbi:DUF998 domain-containing protein [Ornithinimicrobium flavum]|uniref:DUF998 domain-containing protein n=1 Tax=Ornithinimicrobium flavum TaxID=1288636 RepID=UPI001EE90466|nr:DUF998 domain-containing protein [Ornithinimicrobium flavum]
MGLVGVLTFWTGLAALHALRTDLSVVNDYVSDYANGPWGPLFTVVTLVHGVGNLAIAAGLGLALGHDRVARLGVLLFTVATVGLIVAALFPTDPVGAQQTVTGLVHRVAATGSFALELVALALLGLAFRSAAAWRSYASLALGLTVVAALMLAWLLVSISLQWPPGLPERAALLTFTVWEFTTALLLARPVHAARALSTRGRGGRHGDAPEMV